MTKKQLYESIMINVATEVKKALNEELRSLTHDMRLWYNSDKSKYIQLTQDQIEQLNEYVNTYMLNHQCPTDLFDQRYDDETIMNVGGYIIEADLYVAFKDAMAELIEKDSKLKNMLKHNFENDYVKATKRAGRGLKIKNNNPDNPSIPIYWDFSFFGINEKFEIKTKCLNGYHLGGISYTKNLRANMDFILIYCEYSVNNKKYEIEKIEIKRV